MTYGASQAIGRGANWLLLTGVALLLGPTHYGQVALLVAVEGITTSVLLLGQNRVIIRYLSAPDYALSGFRTCLYTWARVAIPTSIAALSAILIFGHHADSGHWMASWALLVFATLLLQLQELYWSYLRARDQAGAFASSQLLFFSLKCALVLGFGATLKDPIAYPLGLVGAAVIVASIRRKTLAQALTGPFHAGLARSYLKFGWPFAFHSLAGALLMYADRFILQVMSGTKAVGEYTFAYSIGSCLAFLYGAAALWFEPYLYRLSSVKESERDLSSYTAMQVLVAASAAGAILGSLNMLANHGALGAYLPSLPIVPIVLGAHLMQPLYLQAHYRLAIHERTGLIMRGSLVAAVTNILANLFLIPVAGMRGAGFATLIGMLGLIGTTTYASLAASKSVTGLSIERPAKVDLLFVPCVLAGLLVAVSANIVAQSVILVALAITAGSQVRRLRVGMRGKGVIADHWADVQTG